MLEKCPLSILRLRPTSCILNLMLRPKSAASVFGRESYLPRETLLQRLSKSKAVDGRGFNRSTTDFNLVEEGRVVLNGSKLILTSSAARTRITAVSSGQKSSGAASQEACAKSFGSELGSSANKVWAADVEDRECFKIGRCFETRN